MPIRFLFGRLSGNRNMLRIHSRMPERSLCNRPFCENIEYARPIAQGRNSGTNRYSLYGQGTYRSTVNSPTLRSGSCAPTPEPTLHYFGEVANLPYPLLWGSVPRPAGTRTTDEILRPIRFILISMHEVRGDGSSPESTGPAKQVCAVGSPRTGCCDISRQVRVRPRLARLAEYRVRED